MDDRQARTRDRIVRVVTEQLESGGYDALQLRAVAKRARVSLTTIYKFFPTRDDLILTALGRWMETNCYASLADPPPDASLYDGQMWFFRKIFEPWERSPRMLEAYHRAVSGPGGERFHLQGVAAVIPAGNAFFENAEPSYVKDFELIMRNMVSGVIQRFAAGEIAITEILPVIERTLFRLTGNNEHLAGLPPGRRIRRRRGPAAPG